MSSHSHVSLDTRLNEIVRHRYMSKEKVLCSLCQKEGRRSRVILYPGKTVTRDEVYYRVLG